MKVVTRYVMPALLVAGAVPQFVEGDPGPGIQMVAAAFVLVLASMWPEFTERQRVAEHRAGYSRGVLAALEVELHHRRTGERRPIPTPDHVHPDDPIEVHL